MRCPTVRFAALALAAAMAVAPFAPAEGDDPLGKLQWIEGPADVTVAGQATLRVPEGYVYLEPAETVKFQELVQNPSNGRESMIAPADLHWFGIFEFDELGFVKDDEKIDAGEILASIRSGTEASNEERRKRGWNELHVVGWKFEPRYDTAPPPDRVRLLWVEFPDYDSEVKALHAVAQSGIGMGLNATGVYNSYYCSQTQAMTMDRVTNKFFPPFNLYVILYGVTSEAQMDYEEKVFREIMAENKATFLTAEHKGDVLSALAPWNLDCIRHVTGFRMNRFFYGGSIVPGGLLKDTAYKTREIWGRTLNTMGETFITDRGGIDDTPFLYAIERGSRHWLSEADVYPDPLDPEKLNRARGLTVAAVADFVSQKYPAIGIGVAIEPLTTFFPEHGPNVHLLFRKLRRIFDPGSICAPGRQVFSEEEMKALPQEMIDGINGLRAHYKMPPVERK